MILVHKSLHAMLIVSVRYSGGFTWLHRNTKCHTPGYFSQMWNDVARLQKLKVFHGSDPVTVRMVVISWTPGSCLVNM